MRGEALLFTGVAVFFGIVATAYGLLSQEPAGTAALIVSAIMSALVAFFLWAQYWRRGPRLQDDTSATVVEGAGPLDFFPPRSAHPVLAALGTALLGTGVVIGGWLFLIGVGVTAAGVAGFVFQYRDRGS
ncbi:cytochrome c oxidase subunit 4 [Streptomyces sp. NPDC059740]|uniref:aa3-type cytochrome oxidase subunit IV n=1 Tax=Streptomyces sp. NPDC059740 TaxID=3346926 RepID=UPI0036563B6F